LEIIENRYKIIFKKISDMISEAQTEQFDVKIQKEFDKVKENVKKPNIFLIGGTGVGKSSIINMIFGEGTVKTGEGNPVTQEFYEKIDLNKNVILYDTKGFEVGIKGENEFEEKVLGFIDNRKNGSLENQIHIVWFAVSGSSDRITDFDLNLYKKLKEREVPVAVIFTKSDNASEDSLNNMVKRLYPNLSFEKSFESEFSPFFTSTDKEAVKQESNLSINKVVDWSINVLPEQLKDAFISAQQSNLELKFERAKSIVYQHSTANVVVGASPIPFSDAPLLIASQSGMIARIVNLYDLESVGMQEFLAGTGAGIIVSNLAKSLVGNLLKFIPGFGTLIGGAINGAVAGAITFAMGSATNLILHKVLRHRLEGNKSEVKNILDNFGPMFKELFNESFKMKKDGRI